MPTRERGGKRSPRERSGKWGKSINQNWKQFSRRYAWVRKILVFSIYPAYGWPRYHFMPLRRTTTAIPQFTPSMFQQKGCKFLESLSFVAQWSWKWGTSDEKWERNSVKDGESIFETIFSIGSSRWFSKTQLEYWNFLEIQNILFHDLEL